MDIEWKDLSDEEPAHGDPILVISSSGVLQHVSYALYEECGTGSKFFNPYFFDYDNDFRIPFEDVSKWAYLGNA
jgi:hypothetical protein